MPARRRNHVKKKERRRPWPYVVTLFFTMALAFYFFYPSVWSGNGKLTIAASGKEKEVYLVTFDPSAETVTTVIFPGNTSVNAANNFGTWQLGSIWELGFSEGLEGELLVNTLMKTFGLPIEAWGESNGSLISIIITRKTNLTIKDRAKLLFAYLRIGESGKRTINATETGFLKNVTLPGGVSGYEPKDEVPKSLLRFFSDIQVSQERARVRIVNKSGNGLLNDQVGKVIEVLGTKIVSVDRESSEKFDCQVVTNSAKITQAKLAQLFSCKKERAKDLAEGEIDFVFGEDFSKRF